MLSASSTIQLRTPADLGLQIRAARKLQGLTQTELAELAGVGTRFVSELERGKRTAQLGLALELARMVGVDILAQPRNLQQP
ncbi:MAG: helix-turn-helix domain-containing protein [Gammaproteobacteria bacterium]|nr:helix-turn-helix domain-containing protein [Gammaproteobacteria bacterium]